MKRLIAICLAGVLLLAAATALVRKNQARNELHYSDSPYSAPPLVFDGTSAELRQTVVVPTLDTPMPAGKNVIWCASFQVAWNRLKDDVLKGPLQLANAAEVADRLNAAPVGEQDLPPGCYQVAAGQARDVRSTELWQELSDDLRRMSTSGDDAPDGLHAVARLRAAVAFTIPYFENAGAFVFTDGEGRQTKISSFGIRPEDEFAYYPLRQQLQVLFVKRPDFGGDADEFAIDLCRDSEPTQVVVARLAPLATLQATLAEVEHRIAADNNEGECRLDPNSTVLVPMLNWRIRHHFAELEGIDKRVLNRGFEMLHLSDALQSIDFRLDRGGVELASEAALVFKPIAIHYRLNRPFLIYLKVRGRSEPYFVMWCANAELLCKPQNNGVSAD